MLAGMYAKFRFNFNIFERQVSISECWGYWNMWNLYDFARDVTKKLAEACRTNGEASPGNDLYSRGLSTLTRHHWKKLLALSGLSDVSDLKINRKSFKHEELKAPMHNEWCANTWRWQRQNWSYVWMQFRSESVSWWFGRAFLSKLDDVISALHSKNAEQHEKAGCYGINVPSVDWDHTTPKGPLGLKTWWKKYSHHNFPRTWIINLQKNSIPIIFSFRWKFFSTKSFTESSEFRQGKMIWDFQTTHNFFALIQPTLNSHRFAGLESSVRSRDVVQSFVLIGLIALKGNLSKPRRPRR